jgi:hypothetical protein
VKIIAFFLSLYFFAGSLMPGSDWDELPKIANLIEHFQEHQNLSEVEISFSEFLFLHYASNSEHPKEGDGKLPFQHTCSFTFMAIIPSTEFKILISSEYPVHSVLDSIQDTQECYNSIFQPPQIS